MSLSESVERLLIMAGFKFIMKIALPMAKKHANSLFKIGLLN